MGASSYMRDRKRIYQEAANRGTGWKKAALRRLDRDYDAEPIRRAGKLVGMRMNDSGLIVCKKKAFTSRELALDSLQQIGRFEDTGHAKPKRVYECPYCHQYHTTKLTSAGQPADVDEV